MSQCGAAHSFGDHPLPRATADIVMNTVALPIEQQVNGVQGML
jgi:hypothetical protein